MKLYINKNFCGYRWFEVGELVNSPDVIALEQAKRNPEMSAIYGKLMIYDIYNYVFLADGDDLILAIRGIEDSRRDDMGRQLNISTIFREENNIAGFESLHKILLAYLSDTKGFSTWFDSLFEPQTAQLDFNVALLKKGLKKIQCCHIISKNGLGGLEYNSSSVYSIASDYSVDSLVEQLGLPRIHVERTKTTINDNKKIWLSPVPVDDEIQRLKEEIQKLEKENEKLKRDRRIPTPPPSIKEIILKYKQYFIIAMALGFVLGLIV